MPTLEWIGKDKVVNHHLEVPYRVLEHQYTYLGGGQTGEEEPDGNKIIRGDNLQALKSLLPQYEGSIKCIYVDPPYNTGNEGWVYNDNVNDPRIKKWLGDVVGKEGEDLSRHDKWLCMMYPRLKLLQRLLSDDGVIFISIDDIEVTYLRLIINEIFGKTRFFAQLIWKSRQNKDNRNITNVSIDHEYVLCYGSIKAVSDLKQQLAAVQEKKDKLLGLYLESTFTKEQLDSRLEPLTAEEKELGLKIKSLSKSNDEIKVDIQEIEETISYLQTIKEKTDRELKSMQFTASKEEILADIDHITVMPDGQLSVRYKAFEEIERLLEKHRHFIPAERLEELKQARRVS